MAGVRREPPELLSVSPEQVQGWVEVTDVRHGGGFVPFGRFGLRLDTVDPSLRDLIFATFRDGRSPFTDAVKAGVSDTLPVPDVEPYGFSILAHELGHALISTSTPMGLCVSYCCDLLVQSWVQLIGHCPDFDGSWSSVVELVQRRESSPNADEELGPSTMTALSDLAAALQTLLDCGLVEPLPRLPASSWRDSEIGYDRASQASWLVLQGDTAHEVVRVPLTYRLISENLCYMAQQVVHTMFGEAYPDGGSLPVEHYLLQLDPATAAYSALGGHLLQRLVDTPVQIGFLPMAVLELSLIYGVTLPRPGAPMTLRPLAPLLEALVEAVLADDAPRSPSPSQFTEFVHQRLRRDSRLAGPDSIEEDSHEALIQGWVAYAEQLERPEVCPQPAAHQRRVSTRMLRSRGGQQPLVFDVMMLHPHLVLDMLLLAEVPVYSDSIVVMQADLLSRAHGSTLSELDFSLVLDLLRERVPRCSDNSGGHCRGVLYGLACNDDLGDDASWHPCGFFHWRAGLLAFVARAPEPPVPGDVLNDLISTQRANDQFVVVAGYKPRVS